MSAHFSSILSRIRDELLGADTADRWAFALNQLPAADSEEADRRLRGFAADVLIELIGLRNPRPANASDRSEWIGLLAALCRGGNPVEILRAASIGFRPAPHPHELEDDEHRIVRLVTSYVAVHYTDRLTLSRLARHFGMSVRRLNATFRRATGQSIRTYITEVRVQRGLQLVADGWKIEAASLTVGYRSKKDFYRAVRLRTGTTPSFHRSVAATLMHEAKK